MGRKSKGKSGTVAGNQSPSHRGRMHPHPEALYYDIALNALKRARSETDEFEKKQLVVIAMVFSALCLEVFINQEYYNVQGLREIRAEVDRIPPETKWLLLPLLLGGKTTFDKGASPFQTYHDLLYTRNQRLVHFKPEREIHVTPPETTRVNEPYFGDLAGDIGLAEQHVDCVGAMIHKLNMLTGGVTEIPQFLTNSKYLSTVRVEFDVNVDSR